MECKNCGKKLVGVNNPNEPSEEIKSYVHSNFKDILDCDKGPEPREENGIRLTMNMMETILATCGKCNIEQQLTIKKHSTKPDDYSFWCPTCEDIISKDICKLTPWFSEEEENET